MTEDDAILLGVLQLSADGWDARDVALTLGLTVAEVSAILEADAAEFPDEPLRAVFH